MSGLLENLLTALEANTESNKALVAQLAGGSEVTSKAATATETKPATTAAKKTTRKAAEKVTPKYTVDEVAAAAVKVKEELGTAAAQELIKEAGKADKLKEMKPENYDAFVEACTIALDPDGAGAETAEAEDDL